LKKILFVLTIWGLLLVTIGSVYALPYTGADIEFSGIEYSALSDPNRWFEKNDTIYTYWDKTWVEYTADLDVGVWNIGINVFNRGMIDSGWYAMFEVFNNLSNEVIFIPASNTVVNSGYFSMNIMAATTTTVRYTWLNDKQDSTLGLDANITITSAFFDDVTIRPQDITTVPEPSTLLLLGAGLVGIAAFKRKSKNN
jgi:hypothetical protein